MSTYSTCTHRQVSLQKENWGTISMTNSLAEKNSAMSLVKSWERPHASCLFFISSSKPKNPKRNQYGPMISSVQVLCRDWEIIYTDWINVWIPLKRFRFRNWGDKARVSAHSQLFAIPTRKPRPECMWFLAESLNNQALHMRTEIVAISVRSD